MARAKRAHPATSPDLDGKVDIDTPPKRSVRQRRLINYAEVAFEGDDEEEDSTGDEAPKKRSRAKAAKTAVEAEEMKAGDKKEVKRKRKKNLTPSQTGSSFQSAIVRPPPLPEPNRAPKSRTKPKPRTMGSNSIELDEHDHEIRKRPFYIDPPITYLVKKERALREPIRFSDRERCDTSMGPQERFYVIGSVGRDYIITVSHLPTCTCPDFRFRRVQCKHIIYVFHKVLHVREELAYQEAFITAELEEIFNNAPLAPHATQEDLANQGKRKPIEDQGCPICYMEFEPDRELIVYCRGTCGTNIHKNCMSQWADTLRRVYKNVTCPFCRQDWRN